MPAHFNDTTIDSHSNFKSSGLSDGTQQQHGNSNDDIVITGFSGRLPESNSIEEFKDHLFAGDDLVTADERRWPSGIYGLPKSGGKLKDVAYFDSTFFGIPSKMANVMDPQLRMLLELTHEAIIDAGINPATVRGSRTGVFIAVTETDANLFWSSSAPDKVNGYDLLGCIQPMLCSRISYHFDFKGPSTTIDSACSGGLFALQQAVNSIRCGLCDAAIVGGVNLLLNPVVSLQLSRLNILNPDGRCKVFDASGNGYVRSDGLVVLYLQKAEDAKRVYANVVNIKSNNDGYKDEGIVFPSGAMQNKLIRETYTEAGIDANDVVYVEAHGTGTKVGDPVEVNSIVDFFCSKNRTTPLLIGSVKSNVGHTECVSGLCGILKVLIAMEHGVIPGNLHFKDPNPDIPAFTDGRLQVVDKNLPWEGGLVGVNSFGFSGTNVHCILKSNPKLKAPTICNKLPYLVQVSGRTEEAVNTIFDKLSSAPVDDELIALLHNIHCCDIPGHKYRGYMVLGRQPEYKVEVEIFNGDERPVWFAYSGLGSQWAGMGRDLMVLEPFEKAIRKCARALQGQGFDLINVIMNGDESTFQNLLNSVVCTVAIQIALTDVLFAVGINPDGIVGHSLGEMCCAYADGALTAQQTILSAYWRANCVLSAYLPPGSMAAVGMSWEEVKAAVPSEIEPACHNSDNIVTISGPPEPVDKFIKKLKAEGIFAKEVASNGYAFHSKYISDAAPQLRISLEKVIPNPRPRSPRWISTSIPESSWNSPLAGNASSDYYVNNFLSPVLFHQAVQHIPENAIIFEIAPSALVLNILKKTLGDGVLNIGLQKRYHSDNLGLLLSNIGKAYNAGVQPNIAKLYKPVEFPVSRNTPMIQSMIRWDHSTEWGVPDFIGRVGTQSGECVVEIDINKEENAFLSGHGFGRRIFFPVSGYLVLVWKTFAELHGCTHENMPVIFENLQFHCTTLMPKEGSLKLRIKILESTGKFELSVGEDRSLTVSGCVCSLNDVSNDSPFLLPPIVSIDDCLDLQTADVYKELCLRGYDYSGDFCGIKQADYKGVIGKLEWIGNWITFIDTMFQFSNFGVDTRELYFPTGVESVIIDPRKHLEFIQSLPELSAVPVSVHRDIDAIKSGYIEVRGLQLTPVLQSNLNQIAPQLEECVFVPYICEKPLSRTDALTVCLQLVYENSATLKLKVIEVGHNRHPDTLLAATIIDILESELEVIVDLTVISESQDKIADLEPLDVKIVRKDPLAGPVGENLHLIVGVDLFNNNTVINNLAKSLKGGGFILLEEKADITDSDAGAAGLELVSKMPYGRKTFYLFRKVDELLPAGVINVTEKNFNWVDDVKVALKQSENEGKRFVIVSQGEETFGLVGMMNCVRHEPGGINIKSVFIPSGDTTPFSPTSPQYAVQLKKDLIHNVLKEGVWGSYRFLRLVNLSRSASLQVEHAYINAVTRGDFSTLNWIKGPPTFYKPDCYPNKELCTVYCASLNFRDVMLASGKLSCETLSENLVEQDCVLGSEFAGRDTLGRRVMGMVLGGALATTVVADFLWEIPDEWSMEQASTVPVAYAVSYYALVVRGRLKPGESLLVQAGTCGVDQAAVAVALHMGCTVYMIVGSQEERDLIKKTFPQLCDKNVTCSYNTKFEQHIRRETNGRGVDVVLNSLNEKVWLASVRCLNKDGRFLGIVKLGHTNSSSLGTANLKNITFHRILLDSFVNSGTNNEDKRTVFKLVNDGIKNNAVKPLPSTVFTESQVEQAFRLMESDKNIHKIILKIRDEEPERNTIPKSHFVNAIPRTFMNPEKSYILIGGLGGIGLEVAHWMIKRGATKIVLSSRSGVRTGYQSLRMKRWKGKDIHVLVSTADVTKLKGAEQIIRQATELAPVGGIFNLACVLKDAFMENQTAESFSAVAVPKVDIIKNLDSASRKLCPQLDYFVAFSSVTCGRGFVGQVNYGLANSAMERICEVRKADGLPGLAIQFGTVADTGIIERLTASKETVINGTLPQRLSSCLATMDVFLQQPQAILSSMVLADKRKGVAGSEEVSLVEAVANILDIKEKDINSNVSTSLSNFGIDSIIGAEVKHTLERDFDIVLSMQEIRGLTFKHLHELDCGEGTI